MRFIGQAVMNNARPGQELCTGQTTQYGGYADDGSLQKGIARAYAVLSSGQYSGTTAIVLNGKTDNHSNNCVLDLVTGLMWTRYASGSVGPGSDGQIPWTTNGNGEGLFTYVAAARSAALAGHTDWRIPNLAELFRLTIWEAPTITLDPAAFPGAITPVLFHTSTTAPEDTTSSQRLTSTLLKTVAKATLLVRGP